MIKSNQDTNSKYNKPQIISASEIGQYNFCSISWKLQKKGFIPKKKYIKRGEEAHISQGRTIGNIENLSISLKIIILITSILLVLALLFIILGVII